MKKTYWYKLLCHYDKNKYVNNCITIPFLIGAGRLLEPEESILSVATLFTSIEDFNVFITIMKCGNIDEYIIGLLDAETEKYIHTYPKSHKFIGKIVCTDQSLEEIATTSEIILKLTLKYNSMISDGFYSKNGGVWGNFTELDIKHISEVL